MRQKMKIRMYNVGFGDCFYLQDGNSNLLVDFGSCNLKIGGKPRKAVFEEIISNLAAIGNKSLLLTHFHLDHLSGLLYMMKNNYLHEFKKIYLPDVFSSKEMNDTLGLLLIVDVMKKSYLPGGQVSLYALAEALCRHPGNVILLSRGAEFEGAYKALWPDTECIKRETSIITEQIEERDRQAFLRVSDFAGELRQVIYSMTVLGRELQGEEAHQTFGRLQKEFRKIRQSIEFTQLLEHMEEKKIDLRQLKNTISIVFQNAKERERSLLFTGDIPSRFMNWIAANYDGKVPLYSHYWCIKVPHHGTGRYYYDFGKYTPENLLISNGLYFANSKTKAKGYRVSEEYTGLFGMLSSPSATMRCSNKDCCNGYQNGCTCMNPDIIAPNLYREIS